VVDIANDEKIIHGPANVLAQGTAELFRAEVGYPLVISGVMKRMAYLQDSAAAANWLGPTGEPYFTKPGSPVM